LFWLIDLPLIPRQIEDAELPVQIRLYRGHALYSPDLRKICRAVAQSQLSHNAAHLLIKAGASVTSILFGAAKIFSLEKVARFLEQRRASTTRQRVCEVVSLKVFDVDVEQGKGRKDRHALTEPLSL
jgi:hypothetical protein